MHKIELTESERRMLLTAALNHRTFKHATRNKYARLNDTTLADLTKRNIETLNSAIAKLKGEA